MAQYTIDNLPSSIDFQESDVVLRTIQNCKNLLMCRMGEVPYDRLRGFDPSLFGLPFPEFENELLPELDRIMMWEPDAEVVDADATIMEDGEIYIQVTIDIPIGERKEG